ncbi:L-glutamate gamma-semialdehyde dehydrogenase [Paludisphaera sp.]|uniref:L-glutamate gamma-semialdehyde dehydrogenase n=1 Tax=Paludisphaera sp. TaxID=2017432 RepID=UPI00301DDC2B
MATTSTSKIGTSPRSLGSGDRARIEGRTREIGRELFDRVGGASRPWRREWWEERFMGATLADPEVRVQLFRFIDALPALRTPGAVRRHLAEYLGEAGDRVPWWLRAAVALAPPGSSREGALASSARAAASLMARKFIAGSTPDEALQTVLKLRARKVAFTADLLGEAVISEHEADAYQRTCLDLIRGLAGPLASRPEIPLIDRDADGPIPRVNLSLKLSSLTTWFDPISPAATIARAAGRLRPILHAARELGAYVHVDMEQYDYRTLSYDLFEAVLGEEEFRDWPDVGIVVQAYQPDAAAELRRLDAFVERRGAPITVRLVKGAYWDYEVLTSRRHGWPEPVFLQKWQSDDNFERCSRFLMERRANLRPAIASHNIRSLAHAMAAAEALGLPADAYELQVLHGMGEAIAEALVERGRRVRVYTPYGAMLPGMAYLVRRLLENTSNESFLKAAGASGVAVDDLLRDPEETGAMLLRKRPAPRPAAPSSGLPPFRNEPLADFARAENRDAMAAALREVAGRLGRTYPLVVDGERIETPDRLAESRDPSRTDRLVGRVATADALHADRAIAASLAALGGWASRPVEERAAVIVRAAAILRERRFELSAWEVYECGKPWREADADICEAIDFCEFYAREMIRLAEPRRRDVPGETNVSDRLPRGVAVVIPPWNFPIAIPCGMTVAPLVAGCPVVLKPAEQAPIVAALLVDILHEAGVPPGVLHYLPGKGEEVGQALANDRRIAVVSFTGSREVGLLLNRQAAETPPGQEHVKRVLAEMGGKNAIIVDDDADLDEAVVGVLQSAFGYAGQKCSAGSRAVVLEGVYDAFVARLAEAGKALRVGPADDPDTFVGPVIDADARRRILQYREVAAAEGRVVLDVDVSALADRGAFVGPLIVADVKPDARIAQEEVFGPILAVLKARDLDDALAIAEGTAYALTGGLYSRSPATIERVRREYRVGNLYINRAITGAMVDRQPFGGFKLSGVGAKAGGPEYLLEFLLTRCVTENTMRRGFAPEDLSNGAGGE